MKVLTKPLQPVRAMLVDIDSTLHPMNKQFVRVLHEDFGIDISEDSIEGWDFMTRLGLNAAQVRAVIARCHADNEIENAEPYPGAIAALSRWAADGVRIHVVSDRRPHTEAATRRWLDKIGLPMAALAIGNRINKITYARAHKLDLIIDDKPSLIEALAAEGIPAATLIHPYNWREVAANPNITASTDWTGLAAELERRFIFGDNQVPHVVLLLGRPGSGKGTLAQDLAMYGYAHVSTGQAMRDWSRGLRPEQQALAESLARGEYGSDELAISIIDEFLAGPGLAHRGVLLDGFPRTEAQLERWLERPDSSGVMVVLELSEAACRRRLARRRQCPADGWTGNSRDAVCGHCGGPLAHRPEDHGLAVDRRMSEYTLRVAPLIERWRSTGLPLLEIDAGRPPDERSELAIAFVEETRSTQKTA